MKARIVASVKQGSNHDALRRRMQRDDEDQLAECSLMCKQLLKRHTAGSNCTPQEQASNRAA